MNNLSCYIGLRVCILIASSPALCWVKPRLCTSGRPSFWTEWGFEAQAATIEADFQECFRGLCMMPICSFSNVLLISGCLWSGEWQHFVGVQKPVYPDLSCNQVCRGLYKKCVQGKALTKRRRQIPRLVAASLVRYQTWYTNPKAPTRQQLRPLTSLMPNRNWRREGETASSLEEKRN